MKLNIIGDIHAHYDPLVTLLAHLDYRPADGVWRHPERQAISVGDLIDSGPKQLGVINLIRGEGAGRSCSMHSG